MIGHLARLLRRPLALLCLVRPCIPGPAVRGAPALCRRCGGPCPTLLDGLVARDLMPDPDGPPRDHAAALRDALRRLGLPAPCADAALPPVPRDPAGVVVGPLAVSLPAMQAVIDRRRS